MNDFQNSIFKQISNKTAGVNHAFYKQAVFDYVCSLMLSRFKWEIPKEITTSQFLIELSLCQNGLVAFIKNDFGYYILPCTATNYNILQEPTQINLINNGNNNGLLAEIFNQSPTDFIICWNSLARYQGNIYLNSLIDDIALTMFLQNSLFNKVKQPYLIQTTDKKVLENRILLNKIQNDEAIFSDDIEKVKVLKLEIETLHFDKLQNRLDDLLRRLHGFLGINYDIDPKRERLITNEVENNNELKNTFSESLLQARQEFCNKVKEKYNIGINVKSGI